MSIRNELLIETFDFYISRRGGVFHEWYVSNTNDGTESLVDEHGVDIDCDGWLVLYAATSNKAKEIVDYFIQSCGMIGSTRNEEDANYVYVYRCAPYTSP